MTDLDQRLEKGTLLLIETGEYSDTSVADPVRLVSTYTKRELVDAFLASQEAGEDPRPDEFLPWLIKTSCVEAVDNCHRWHVGSYSEFDPHG